jgi:hypothetical protein
MSTIRRRLASCALVLTVLQLTLLFTAPISACCARSGGSAAVKVAASDPECCPAGSHPPGECPLHKGSKGGAPDTRSARACRMMCDAPHGPQFLIGGVGVLGVPQEVTVSLTSSALPAAPSFLVSRRSSIPDAPPPKFLL